MTTIKSSLELLKYIAANKLLQFNRTSCYGYNDNSLNWSNKEFREYLESFNPTFIAQLTEFLIDKVIVPNEDHYSEFFVTPIIMKEKVCYKLSRCVSSEGIDEYEANGAEDLNNYIDIIILKLIEIKELEGIDATNFENYFIYSNRDGGSELEIFDSISKTWQDFEKFEFGYLLIEILDNLLELHIRENYYRSDEVYIDTNTIMYYLEEDVDGDELTIKKSTGKLFKDDIIYQF